MTDKQRSVLKIKKYPESILRKKSIQVPEITPTELKLFEDMLLTMYTFSGIGLSGPQIGSQYQIIVADIGEGPIRLVNPKIVKTKGEDKFEEALIGDIHEVVDEACKEYPCINDALKEIEVRIEKGWVKNPISNEKIHSFWAEMQYDWFIKWFGEKNVSPAPH